MRNIKLLIIIVLLFVFSKINGQIDNSLLERIDFNDTTLVDSEFLKTTLANYIDSAKNPQLPSENQMYNYILAADNILKECSSYPMYAFVYQYLICGFSDLGANLVVDYLTRMPYLNYINADTEQKQYIINIAESYQRVKIGFQAPNIQSLTINNEQFDLYNVNSEYTIILFWSYSCRHCRDLIGELADFVRENKDCKIVTVNVSGDLKKVRRFLKKQHLADYNICDGKGWSSTIVSDYAVDMTPSLFLLDKNKIIIAKPFNVDEILNSIEL